MSRKIIMESEHKMLFHSGFKTFDRQTILIDRGNVQSPTQKSSYIAPRMRDVGKPKPGIYHTEAELTYQYGELTKVDLDLLSIYAWGNYFHSYMGSNLPIAVKDFYDRDLYPEQHETILYYFCHRHRRKQAFGQAPSALILDGWAITSVHHALIRYGVTGPTWKSELAVKESLSYLLEPAVRIARRPSILQLIPEGKTLCDAFQNPQYMYTVTTTLPFTLQHSHQCPGNGLYTWKEDTHEYDFSTQEEMWDFLAKNDYKPISMPRWANPPKSAS